MRIYVGNLPWSVDNDSLRDLFSSYGDVADAVVIRDRETGRSRGFGFVDLSDDEAGNAAIEAMHGTEIEGRDLVVNQAQERKERNGGGGGGGGWN
ncbi:MAG TPA: RNA-binding protein [Planctomycetes bacterium]|nr:RNA-binding protein [Planctomycetota bacterium]|tara:strand:- start:36 stop:320 length:285 start_codon:yes stop_codon:yes gene_type:complete